MHLSKALTKNFKKDLFVVRGENEEIFFLGF